MRSLSLLLAAFCVALAPGTPRAQSVINIPNPDPFIAEFGTRIAPLGADLLVATGAIAAPGRVYLVGGGTGALLRTFANPDPMLYGNGIGTSVAALGGNALVGAAGTGGAPSAVLLFDGTTGALIRTFPNPTGAGTLFGASVAALGSNVLVGQPSTSAAGAAYLFDAATGALLKTFQAPAPTNEDGFGTSVAALGSDVLVGAPGSDDAGEDAGAVYLFDAATGALLQTFLNPTPTPPGFGFSDGFGASIAAAAGNVLVSAPFDDAFDTDSGIAYLFDPATGALIRPFNPPAPGSGHLFGYSVASFGSHAVIGTEGLDAPRAAYVFDEATGSLERTLHDPTPGEYYRSQVTVLDGHPVVSNAGDSNPFVATGAVYVYCGGATGCGPCETCGPGGTCVAAPNPTCRAPTSGRTALRIVNHVATDDGDVVLWRALGIFDGQGEHGDSYFAVPTDAPPGHDYTTCIYDESGPPSLLFRATAPAGGTCGTTACWTESPDCTTTSCGFVYRDGDRTPDGLKRLVAALGPSQRAPYRTQLKVIGKGENLSGRPGGLPPLPLSLPVRLQLQVRDGLCWEAEYSTARTNTDEVFRATSD